MPIIKSAQKRVRQAKKHQAYNVATKTKVKASFKAVRDELAAGKPKDNKALIAAIKEVDLAVKRGVIKKSTAARKKSRLTLAYNATAAKPYGTENPGKPDSKATEKKATPKKPAAKKAPASKKAAPKKPTAKKK